MDDFRDDGQAAFHADMLKRQQDEEEALLRVKNGTATPQDAEILASGCGIDIRKLKEAA